MLVAGALLFSQSHDVAKALPTVIVSPNPADIVPADGSNDPNFSRSFDHVLKKEGTSVVDKLQLSAYFTTPSPTEVIRITNRTDFYSKCSVQGSSAQFIQVTISDGASTLTYNVPQNRICDPAPTNRTNNRGGNGSQTINGAYFFANYQVPSTFNIARPVDPGTGMYKLDITIKYASGIPTGDTSDRDNRQIITFKARLNPCNGSGCTKYIGTAPIAGGARNFSTLGYTDSQNNANGNLRSDFANEYFKFGLPCNVNSQQQLTVNVYDIDNQTNWGGRSDPNGRFGIEYKDSNGNWVPMKLNTSNYTVAYRDANNNPINGGSFVDNGFSIKPIQQSGVSALVKFFLQPYTNYRIVAKNIYSGNLLGVGLPTATIFGDIECSSSLNGHINTTPSTGVDPIESGQTISIDADGQRTGTTSFISRYNSSFRVWYDTGDSAYQAGETVKCFVTADRTQAGATTLGLGNCNNIVADPAQSNGAASAICAQLVLTLNPADTLTQIGTGAAPNGITRCFRIGKYPHLEARNGDVFAGGQFASASPTCTLTAKPVIASSQRQIPIGGAFYTSYATYGVTSLGSSTTFGSMGVSYDTSATTIADNLVFANTTSVDGYFYNATGNNNTPTVPHCLNDPFAVFGPRATNDVGGTTVDISSLTSDTNLTATTTINLYASQPIPPGKKIVIYAKSADIKISSNITYADQAYGSVNQIPQVVILTDKSILVRQNSIVGGGQVTQLDGIYAAKINLYTCDFIPRLHLCDAPLKINGAVVVGQNTIPLRTSGATTPVLGGMAETFNLRSDMFLDQLPEAGGPNVFIKTMSETEVPPRF